MCNVHTYLLEHTRTQTQVGSLLHKLVGGAVKPADLEKRLKERKLQLSPLAVSRWGVVCCHGDFASLLILYLGHVKRAHYKQLNLTFTNLRQVRTLQKFVGSEVSLEDAKTLLEPLLKDKTVVSCRGWI